MKIISYAAVVLVTALILAGCGETISGVGKDFGRIGQGVNTVLFRQ